MDQFLFLFNLTHQYFLDAESKSKENFLVCVTKFKVGPNIALKFQADGSTYKKLRAACGCSEFFFSSFKFKLSVILSLLVYFAILPKLSCLNVISIKLK